MIQNLERIEYRRGVLEKGMRPEDLPVEVWRNSEILAGEGAAINAENLLNLGGVVISLPQEATKKVLTLCN